MHTGSRGKPKILMAAAVFHIVSLLAALASEELKMPVLTVDGRSYTNARVVKSTAVDALVFHDGGGAKIPLAKLPPEIQKHFNYDPELAKQVAAEAKVKAEKAAKAQAEYRATVAARDAARGEPKKLLLMAVSGSAGFERCYVSIDGESAREIITTPPAIAKKHLQDVDNLTKQVERFQTQVEKEVEAAELADANAPTECSGTIEFVAQCQAQRQRANQMIADANRRVKELTAMQDKLSSMKADSAHKCAFYAAKTLKKYANLEVWEYLPNPVIPKKSENAEPQTPSGEETKPPTDSDVGSRT